MHLRLFRLLSVLLASLSVLASVAQEPLGELVSSVSTGKPVDKDRQADNSRIYLKDQGAIWVSRDITRFAPVLDVTVTDAIEVIGNQLKSPISFNIRTNYAYYVEQYKLEIFRRGDRYYSQPLKVIAGETLGSNVSLSWDGVPEDGSNWKPRPGDQLLFRLTVKDKDGNIDASSTGVTEFYQGTREAKMERLANKEGITFGKATLMRHNIPTSAGMAKFIGSGLFDVQKVKVGDDEYVVNRGKLYGEKYLPTGAYDFPVTITYKDKSTENFTLYARIPDNYFAQTGLIDLYVGKNFVGGTESVLDNNFQYQGDIYNQGRIAYFGEAKLGDKWRLTAHVDTWEDEIKNMFKHPFESRERSVFDILEDDDPELYYGSYGDNSNIYNEVFTKGKVFLAAEYDKSMMIWGNYNTGFTGTETASYNRSLYGFRGDFRTRTTTEWGDDVFAFTGFTAEADTAYAHDELMGTGTSVYFLRNGEVVPGSDKVYLRQIDVQTHQIVSQITLKQGADYDIDPYQGRIILNQPLASRALLSNQPLINNNLGGEVYNYLAVDYEYVPRTGEKLDNMTYGARAKGFITKHLGLGATYVKEDKHAQSYELTGGDITLRFTEGSFIKAEYATSEGTQVDRNLVSTDGGLTFNQADTIADKRDGNMVLVNSVINLYDLMPSVLGVVGNDLGLWYKEKDAGFSYASQFDDLEQKNYGGQLRLQFADRVQFVTRYKDTDEKKPTGKQVTQTEETEVELGWLITNHVKVAVAGEKIKELDAQKLSSDADLAGLRLDYIYDQANNIYLKGQKTVNSSDNYRENDSVTFGWQTRLLRTLNLAGDYTSGDRGETSQLTLGYDRTNTHNTYVTWLNNDFEDKNNLVFGQKGKLTDNLSAFQENQFVAENNGKGRVDSFGFNYKVNNILQSGVSFQQGFIDKDDESRTKRTAGSVYWVFDNDRLYFTNKLEARYDKNPDEIEQYVTINRYIQQLTLAYTLYGKFNYTQSKNKTQETLLQRFIEGSAGLAYRPVYNDRWNTLGRYTYLRDIDRRERTPDPKNEKAHIFEAETIYDLNEHIDLGAKAAWKKTQQTFYRADFDGNLSNSLPIQNDIYLLAVNAAYAVMNNWEVLGEYHWKADRNTDDVHQGALVSLNKQIGRNLKLGIGYNFSDFHDDLVHKDDYEAHGFFINMLGTF